MVKVIFETERLKLEELNDSNFNDLSELLANENVHRFFPKTALNKGESREFLERAKSKYQADGYFFWAVIRKSDNKFIGICGVLKQIIDGTEEAEIGYRITDSEWGKGYGTEAAKGCMIYARDTLKKESIISLIRPINEPSIRVAEKNGLTFEKDTIFHNLEHRIYRFIFQK